MVKSFCHNRSLQEIERVRRGQAEDDVYLQYRETLALLAHHYHHSSCTSAILQDDGQTTGLILQIKGLRQSSEGGTPLFEVQYMYNTRYALLVAVVALCLEP